jgi:lysyl-tRNA synthetase class 2
MPRKPRSNPKTKHKAIKLRKESTPAERKLWSRIRNDQLGVTFRRQHAVGSYIPDFPWHRSPGRCARPKQNLLLNLMDSLRSQHLEQADYDDQRTKYLQSQGYKVIRIWNKDVANRIEEVILAITHAMHQDRTAEE